MRRVSIAIACSVVLCSCATSERPSADLPRGAAAYAAMPAASANGGLEDYRIGALDSLDVNVLQEPELSVKRLQVDATGNVSLPLVGSVAAAGKTTSELSAEIARRLGAKYLVNPQVTVAVSGSVSQKVVVQGAVTEPGVYEIKGRTTLLEALSMAKGETRIAMLKEVVVFRTVGGTRMGAVFDVASIRTGEAEDPEILGNDVVVVAQSNAKSVWRDVLGAVPILNVFRPLAY